MGFETASRISELNPLWPLGADLKAQGDDHIRRIKEVLQGTFPNASKQFRFPSVVNFASSGVENYNVAADQDNTTFFMNPGSGQINFRLPTLSASDAGWSVRVMNTHGGVPLFIFPPSGNLVSGGVGLQYTRRQIPNEFTTVIWSGGAFYCTRVPNVPVGAIITHGKDEIPNGYVLPNGQHLGVYPGLYPDYSVRAGGGQVVDLRGQVVTYMDQGRGILSTFPQGWGGEGGEHVHTLTKSEVPNLSVSASGGGGGSVDWVDSITPDRWDQANNAKVNNGTQQDVPRIGDFVFCSATTTVSVSVNGGTTDGGGIYHNNTQPSHGLWKLVVVE